MMNLNEEYENKRLYDFKKIKNNLRDYFGFSSEQLLDLFQNYNIITSKKLHTLLEKDNLINKHEIDLIIKEYHYYTKVLDILSKKGLKLLDLINYISVSTGNTDKNIHEKELKNLEIYHYSSIILGESVKEIINTLHHILSDFSQTLKLVNNLVEYKKPNFNHTLFDVSDKKNYPSKNLIGDEDKLDKTSFSKKKKRNFA